MSSLIFKQKSGFSLLELLLALLFVNIALALSLPKLKETRLHRKNQEKILAQEVLAQTVLLEIEKGLAGSETFFAIPGLEIKENAQELLTDAKKASSCLSFLHLSPLLLRKASPDVFCLEKESLSAEEKELIEESTQYLLLSSLKAELAAQSLRLARTQSAKNLCGKLISYAGTSNLTQDFAYLSPVVDRYSLYLDSLGRLRKLSLIRGSRQTLANDLEMLEIKKQDSLKHGFSFYVKVKTKGGLEKERLFSYGSNKEHALKDFID